MTSMLIDLDVASQMVFENAQKMAEHIPVFAGSAQQKYEMHELAANTIMRGLMKVFNHDCPLDERTRNNIISHHIEKSKSHWMYGDAWAEQMKQMRGDVARHLRLGNISGLTPDTTRLLRDLDQKGHLDSVVSNFLGLHDGRDQETVKMDWLVDPKLMEIKKTFSKDRDYFMYEAMMSSSETKSKEHIRDKAFQNLSAEHTAIYHQVQARSPAAGQKLLDWVQHNKSKAKKIFDFYINTTDQVWINGMDKSLAHDSFQLANFVDTEHIKVMNTAAAELGQALLWNKQSAAHSFIHTMVSQWVRDVAQWSITSLDVMSAAAMEVEMESSVEAGAGQEELDEHVTIETDPQEADLPTSVTAYRARKHSSETLHDKPQPPTP